MSAEPAPRCAEWAREHHVDPIGTAGTHRGYLLVEWPTPWPSDIGDEPALATLAASAPGYRVQALMPRDPSCDARRVVLYRRPDPEWFGGFERIEVIAAHDESCEVALALITGVVVGAITDHRFTTDVLVCTHGRRDVCCGAKGTSLVNELCTATSLPRDVRLWRTSHTGGHRFAPTGIVLPEGTVWAFLDAHALQRILARDGALGDLLPRYRGSAGIGSPAVQALERIAFGQIGWSWLDWRRRGSVDKSGRVQLDALSPSGERARWSAAVRQGQQLPVPICGQPISAATKVDTQVRLGPATRTT